MFPSSNIETLLKPEMIIEMKSSGQMLCDWSLCECSQNGKTFLVYILERNI